MSGEAMRMRIELVQLMRRHQVAPKPFTPTALLPAVDHNVIVEGYAAPATIDREHAKFAGRCWLPFRKNIPLLFRHGRPAGEVQEVRSTDEGLYVRALVTDSEAKQCPYFSVAATVHHYMLRNVDDPERFHGLVTCATLDEVSITSTPANPRAVVAHRYPALPVAAYLAAQAESTALLIKGVGYLQRMTGVLADFVRASSAPERPPAPRHPIVPAVRRQTEFARLVEEINCREQH
ncbi:hypothetical protein AAFX91_27960 [Bradyrhizobium sp. 31Argb]|uniref:hypothetical protein n=1 Tax=Bradyrhizobium sp. 31Argb TaxID=3141247 RepID=UPI003747D45F